ncbi:MAG: hypothetical protein IKW89_03920 [Bacteroidales bacterium]|nr:hypothetical protein [Bacteroidales bacterium]
MKVRDIKTYIQGYCKDASIEKLGTDEEPFLSVLHGFGQRIDPTVTNVARFAKDSEEQLFYEFVQNAFDANADSLCFFFDKDYLIVLNNGEPFFTDPIGPDPRDGQLYNFLTKGKSLKAGDDSKSGEFGQGSKLLYNLIADKSVASNSTLLLKAIKECRKGPYLVSWGNRVQLDNFRLQSTDGWTYTDPYKEDPDLLVCKILMTYFPIAPGVDNSLFSRKEFHDIRAAFERLVDPKRNINRLKTGTAIIIPLGKGQYEAIADEKNIGKVLTRLAGFTVLTADKEKNKGRRLDHIYINHQEVEMQHVVHSLSVDFTIPDTEGSFSYQFAFNPAFAKDGTVTLFRTLPITETRYKMGFIIDSQNFDHDDSRQRINDTRKTELQLTEAFRHLLEQIKRIKADDKEQFDYIYQSILASQPLKDNEDVQFISRPFYATFLPFIRDNVKTQEGDYLPMSMVRKPEGSDMIPLDKLGIKAYRWVSEDISKGQIQRFGIKLDSLTLKDILLAADDKMLAEWIKTIGKDRYEGLHGEFLRLSKEESTIARKHVFLTNKGNVYSLDELLTFENPVILYDATAGHNHLDRCPEIEYVLGPITYFSEDQTLNIGTINISKIASHIGFYREGSARTDVAGHILVDARRLPRTLTAIKEKVLLFQSLDGVYRPMAELIRRKPEGSILFDNCCVAGYVPDILPDDLFISTPKDIWSWLLGHMAAIEALPDWADQNRQYLKDIRSIFETAERPSGRIALYLDENGVPTDEKCFLLRSSDKLDSEQYDRMAMFASTKGYPLVPYQFKGTLSEAPFETDSVSVSEILDSGATVDARLLQCIVKITGASILRAFKVSFSGNDNYAVTKLAGGSNYTCAIDSEPLDAALKGIGYNRIDPEVCRYFVNQLAEYELTTNNAMMESVLGRLPKDKLPVLLPVVKLHNDSINRIFFENLQGLAVDSALEEDDITWQIIRYALGKDQSDGYYRARLMRLITHKGQHLPETIKSNIVSFNGTDYDLYLLLGDAQTENELADSFFGCLPDPALFRKFVYSDSEEAKSAEDVYDELYNTYLSVEQLRFCLDYSITKKVSYKDLEIDEDESLSEALDMISQYGFVGFDEYFTMKDFDKDKQVYAPKELLLAEEQLPEAVSAWIGKDREKALLLLRGLKTEACENIAIRAALKENASFQSIQAVVNDEACLHRTVRWIVDQHFNIPLLYTDARFVVLSNLLDKLPEDMNPLPGLRFPATLAKDELGLPVPILSFEYMAADGALMTFENVRSNVDQIDRKVPLKQFFAQNKIYGYNGLNLNFLMSQGLNDRTRYVIRTTAEKKDYEEWNTNAYAQWKDSDESGGVRIFLSQAPVGIILSVINESTGEQAVKIASKSDLFGYDADEKKVIIQHPNQEGLTEMKTLERVAKATQFFKDPFIALQSIYVDMVEQGIDPNALSESEKKAVEMAQALGEETVDKINENLDTIKDIVEGLTEEELKTVAENKDKIRNLLEDMPDDDDESMQSKVRKTIGYIGELIYEQYLKNNHIEHEYAAAQGVGDYDFKLKATTARPAIYVDVKTNLYSFKEEAVPFYIHKSQNRFMQMHPDEQFRIVRISLTDLDLNKSYERIRDLYGAEADYEANPALKKACQDIAKKYWRGAEIEEFDSASPEYGIKIEKLPRV